MSTELIQYNSGEHVFGGENIAEAISTDGDIAFNESYIVVGNRLEARKIYATYDLTVHGDVIAEEMTVNGTFFVMGDIEAAVLNCHGKFICSGEVRVKQLNVDGFFIADAISSDEVQAANDLFVHTTIDTNKRLEVAGLVVAAEGIMGVGEFNAKSAVANEYFEFDGRQSGNVFEVSSMKFAYRNQDAQDVSELDIADAINIFNKSLAYSVKLWSNFEEDKFVGEIRETSKAMPDLASIVRVVKRIIEISYDREIHNLRDYLFVLWAKEIFPESLLHYETLEGVFGKMFDEATPKLDSLEFHSDGIKDLSDSLYVLSTYAELLPIGYEECADRIFSSIGLRYITVKNAMEGHR